MEGNSHSDHQGDAHSREDKKLTPFSSVCVVADRSSRLLDCSANSESNNIICPDRCSRISDVKRRRVTALRKDDNPRRISAGGQNLGWNTYFQASGPDK